MQRLRDLGVYLPPGGQRPVYALRNGNGYLLYDARHGVALPPRFEVGSDGAVKDWHAEPAGWTVDDLTDTGETFSR